MDQLNLFDVAPQIEPDSPPQAPATAKMPPPAWDNYPVGTDVYLLPFTDQNGKRHAGFVGMTGTVVGFNAVGMTLVKFGSFHPYPAESWRLVQV